MPSYGYAIGPFIKSGIDANQAEESDYRQARQRTALETLLARRREDEQARLFAQQDKSAATGQGYAERTAATLAGTQAGAADVAHVRGQETAQTLADTQARAADVAYNRKPLVERDPYKSLENPNTGEVVRPAQTATIPPPLPDVRRTTSYDTQGRPSVRDEPFNDRSTMAERLADVRARAKSGLTLPGELEKAEEAFTVQRELEIARAGGRKDVMLNTPMSPKEASGLLHPKTRTAAPVGVSRQQALDLGFRDVDDKDREALFDLGQVRQQVASLFGLSDKLITARNPMEAGVQFTQLSTGAYTGSNEQARLYMHDRDAFLGTIARSLGGERGVLTNQDVGRVGRAFPNFFDTRAVALGKRAIINDLLSTAEEARHAKMFGEPVDPKTIEGKVQRLLDSLEAVGKEPETPKGSRQIKFRDRASGRTGTATVPAGEKLPQNLEEIK